MDNTFKNILVKRGIDNPIKERDFFVPKWNKLFHDTEDLTDIDVASERVRAAIKKKQKIAIYGDYDGDGVPGAAVLFLGLKKLGAKNPVVHIGKSHEIDTEFIKEIARKGFKLLITVDMGAGSSNAIDAANYLGLDIIIIDHHMLIGPRPRVFAYINPKQPGDKYIWPHLCGCALVVKFIYHLSPAVFKKYRSYFISLAMISTVHDYMPFKDENWLLVKEGLKEISKTKNKNFNTLIKTMKTISSLEENIGHENAFHIIEPLLQMFDSQKACELLINNNYSRAKINKLAGESEKFNNNLNEAVLKIKNGPHIIKNIMLFEVFENVPYITIGAVASRVFNLYGLPTFIVRKGRAGFGRASVRSPKSLNLIDLLSFCSGSLESYGGHPQAAGFKIRNSNIDAFRDKAEEYLYKNYPQGVAPKDEVLIDSYVAVSTLTPVFYKQLASLAPFGPENPVPLLIIKEASLSCEPSDTITDKTGSIPAIFNGAYKELDLQMRYNVYGNLILRKNVLYFRVKEVKPIK